MERAGQTYYYHPNALGTVEALTDSGGNVVERYMYDAYGQVTVLDGSYNPVTPNIWGTPHSAVTNRFLYTGREFDEENGLYFFRARYYSPAQGRFIQRDPALYLYNANAYEYVNGRVTVRVDPRGLGPNGLRTTRDLQALRRQGRIMTATTSLETPLTQAELDELKGYVENGTKGVVQALRFNELQIQFRNAGTKFGGQKELETLSQIVGLATKICPKEGHGRVFKKALDFYVQGIKAAIAGIKNIDEKKYEQYKMARDGGAPHEDAYTFKNYFNESEGENYQTRYELDKLQRSLADAPDDEEEDDDEFLGEIGIPLGLPNDGPDGD